MHRRAGLVAAIPVLALVGALPFVNRLEPVVLGLPFVLFWILAWVLVTPVFLGVAHALGGFGSGDGEPAARGGEGHPPGDGEAPGGRR